MGHILKHDGLIIIVTESMTEGKNAKGKPLLAYVQ